MDLACIQHNNRTKQQVGTRQQLQLIAALPGLIATQQHRKLALVTDVLLTSLVRGGQPPSHCPPQHAHTPSMRARFHPKPSSASCRPARPLTSGSSTRAAHFACNSTIERLCALLQRRCCTWHTLPKTKHSTYSFGMFRQHTSRGRFFTSSTCAQHQNPLKPHLSRVHVCANVLFFVPLLPPHHGKSPRRAAPLMLPGRFGSISTVNADAHNPARHVEEAAWLTERAALAVHQVRLMPFMGDCHYSTGFAFLQPMVAACL